MASIPTPRAMLDCEVSAFKDHPSSEAYFDGRAAGLAGNAIALNKHEPGTLDHAEWNRGWRSGNAQRCAEHAKRTERALKIAAELRERARTCAYTDRPCDCNRTGRCLDTV